MPHSSSATSLDPSRGSTRASRVFWCLFSGTSYPQGYLLDAPRETPARPQDGLTREGLLAQQALHAALRADEDYRRLFPLLDEETEPRIVRHLRHFWRLGMG